MIYFLSDAHIGSRAMDDPNHQQRFIEMLTTLSTDATAFYLLGDIFDFWYEYVWPDKSKEEEYAPLLDCLRAITDRGIEVHYFVGNHDMWTFGWLAKRTGVIVHRKQPEPLTIAGKRCFLAHGDGLVPTDYFSRLSKDIQKKIRTFMRLQRIFHSPVARFFFGLLPPAFGNRLGYGWTKKSREKELANPCDYKGENSEELVLYAKEQDTLPRTPSLVTDNPSHIDYYIFGHRHIELDLQLASGARVLILGDCFRHWTYAAMNEQGKIELRCIQEQNS